ncbi:FtsX-like permease family protein [Venatoribacter cucullus]|uniref:FtsX-like permease family protein n=1 Tax=Venatoribacter cucullus TaxID=2661630 RepID=A0A9E8FPF7_9GAMM|nr:FtsX-like permease family protein [Oceanospirillaceae bacterium ASx5O]QQD25505.1 FtsX-like permease family protein [Venatoribacter cucullus]UZK04915.1 FtsX-like permease family protein [Venatoribacter cucullus]
MMLGNAFKLALQEIRRNILRSFLTTLGIIIGVAAVITMVTLGKGATAQVTEQIASLGSNLLMINRGQGFGPGRDRMSAPAFTLADAEAVRNEIAGIKALAPMSNSSATLVVGNNNWSSTIRGSTNEFLLAGNWALDSGREFTAEEETVGGAVCIVGQTIIRQLLKDQPLGQTIRIGRFTCTVVGTFKGKGQTSFGQDQDDVVLLPFPTFAQRIAGSRDVQQIYVSLHDGVDSAHVKNRLTELLKLRRNIGPSSSLNFNIMDTTELADTLTSTTRTMTSLLGAVAGVSLLVGGIGIMNIMLVSVTERTREIGIRLAIGALEHEVLWQFLVEAVVLSSLGGLLGVLLAVGLSFGLSLWMGMPYVFDPGITLIAFVFSALVGVVFGYFPARRAARLNPIDALRTL